MNQPIRDLFNDDGPMPDKKCPVCGRWFFDLRKHAESSPDPEHSIMIVHLV